jgi:HPt (histidine-containing phosphotransfer) domain-containing protein
MSNNLHLPSEELKNQYIHRRREELKVYIDSLKSQDFEAMGRIGHRMRGNGISFGFPELSALGEKMETAAKQKKLSVLRELSIEFMNWLDGQNSRKEIEL